ncbi:MAG: hypothetical protein ACRC4O_04960 [Giesbergeria sp.]
MSYPANTGLRCLLLVALKAPLTTADAASRVRCDVPSVKRVLGLMQAEGLVVSTTTKTRRMRAGVTVWGLSVEAVEAEARRLRECEARSAEFGAARFGTLRRQA